ncbi:uncharacterized protein LY89DRAFT_778808 [Mollisia scopiformis]|uniref:Uncharacterized protein n=1 Tax=Mollisia scopiformis TaxID=149040 RepID=A0A194XLZ6_MOLSC|nr:uncharacterized protein LY89DRAFT_778808 [Mollisia scopiformis]KUJ21203.1 hypothetical protein LY89DRAFT_778808 [Mollisia scopiformis]
MSNNATQNQEVAEASDEEVYAQSDEEEASSDAALVPQQQTQQQVAPQPRRGQRQQQQPNGLPQMSQQVQNPPARAQGYRPGAIRESRIKDRPVASSGASDSALKIKIELDLEVEVDLYARVKGDVTIGLM